MFETFVRGRVFQVTMATIFDMIKHVKRELDAQFHFNQPPGMTDIGVKLTGDPNYV